MGNVHHPYFPRNALIPGYAPNTTPIPVLIASLGTILGVFTVGCVTLAKRYNQGLTRADQLTIGWFTLCGFLHCFFEGYFVLNHASLASSQSLFAQLWKEYALSDSRYLTSDPFMLCIETLTVLTWGPLSFLTALLTARNRNAQSGGQGAQHLLQAIVCVGHLYGVALYYGTCGFAEHMRGLSYSRPEAAYYWGYYVGMNAPWVVVPSVLLWRSAGAIRRAVAAAAVRDAVEEKKER